MTETERRMLACFQEQYGVYYPDRGKAHLIYRTTREIIRLWRRGWDSAPRPAVGELRSLCGVATWWPQDIRRRSEIYRQGEIRRDIEWSLGATGCGHCRKKLQRIMHLNGEGHKLIVWEV